MRLPLITLMRSSRGRLVQGLALLLLVWILSVMSPYRLALVKKSDTMTTLSPVAPSVKAHMEPGNHNVSDRVGVIQQPEANEVDNNYGDEQEESYEDDPEKVSADKLNYTIDYEISGEALANTRVSVTRVCTQEERLAHLRAYCKNNSQHVQSRRRRKRKRSNISRHIIVDDKHALAYCPLPKVACTSWKSLLVYAMNYTQEAWPPVHNARYLNKAGLKMIGQLSMDEKSQVNQSYFKYIVVRHPFERIISAWRDKLVQKNSPYRRSMGKQIVQVYRNFSDRAITPEWTGTAMFHEFAEYLSDYKVHNQHWAPYGSYCTVCSVPYDGVFRTETAEHDGAAFVREHLPYYQGAVPFIHSHQDDRKILGLATKVLTEFAKVSPKAFDYLLRVYGPDLEMFGYKWDRGSNTAKCVIQTGDGSVCC